MSIRELSERARLGASARETRTNRAWTGVRRARQTDLAATLGNQSVQRLFPTNQPMRFPHASRVRAALGTSAPLQGVHDPDGCAMRRTLAFTDGAVTHFAKPVPDLHVATHEAVHQLQHAGLTNDAGLGAEGQACAAADAARAGQSASWLIGGIGARVPVAERHYVYTDKTGRWKDISGGAALGRLSETGETLTFHSHDAYATAALIASAGAILRAKRSGVELADGGPGPQVDSPDGSGGKTLSKIDVKQVGDPASKEFYGDCGRMAREVMGPTAKDSPASVVCSPGGVPRVIDPVTAQKAAKEQLALLLFMDGRIRGTPGYEAMSAEDKKKIADAAYNEYKAWSQTEKDEFVKTQLEKGRLPADKAKEIGIDEYAAPAIGEAYTIVRSGATAPQEYPYHWAAVIMIAGENRVTLENAAESSDYEQKNAKWYIETYGPASKQQSYHEEWKGAFGANPHTLTARTQPPPPSYAAEIPGKSTSDLVALYTAPGTTPDDRYYLKQELDKRVITATVLVKKQEDWTGDDEPFLEFSVSGGVKGTKERRIKEGSSGTFTMTVGFLLPLDNPLTVFVREYDLLDPSDTIGTISWDAPYKPLTMSVTGDDANYVVTLTM